MSLEDARVAAGLSTSGQWVRENSILYHDHSGVGRKGERKMVERERGLAKSEARFCYQRALTHLYIQAQRHDWVRELTDTVSDYLIPTPASAFDPRGISPAVPLSMLDILPEDIDFRHVATAHGASSQISVGDQTVQVYISHYFPTDLHMVIRFQVTASVDPVNAFHAFPGGSIRFTLQPHDSRLLSALFNMIYQAWRRATQAAIDGPLPDCNSSLSANFLQTSSVGAILRVSPILVKTKATLTLKIFSIYNAAQKHIEFGLVAENLLLGPQNTFGSFE